MTSSRWIRLDTTWDHSEWVAALEPEGQLAWVKLLCHVKAHGYAGSVKRLGHVVAARLWGLRVTAVTEMEEAAVADGALVVDGDEWIISGWGERQSDPKAKDRMRAYRERQQLLTEESTDSDVTRNSRNVTGVTTETPTETETETKETDTSETEPHVSAMWAVWLNEFGGTSGRKPKFTAQRRAALKRLYNEQLKGEPDPLATFRKVLRAVVRSDHHMSKREYQYPESLFRNEERRDRWVQAAVSENGSSKPAQPVRFY